MKLYQSITVCLALMAGVTADGCFAQSATNPNESEAAGNAPQDPAVAVPTVTPAPPVSLRKTREQVMRELEDFQKSGQALSGLLRNGKQDSQDVPDGVQACEDSLAHFHCIRSDVALAYRWGAPVPKTTDGRQVISLGRAVLDALQGARG